MMSHVRSTPQHCPTPRELDDLELLMHGVLGVPARFEDGLVTLAVPPDIAAEARTVGALELVDPEGVPLAQVRVDGQYAADDLVGITGEVIGMAHPEYG